MGGREGLREWDAAATRPPPERRTKHLADRLADLCVAALRDPGRRFDPDRRDRFEENQLGRSVDKNLLAGDNTLRSHLLFFFLPPSKTRHVAPQE